MLFIARFAHKQNHRAKILHLRRNRVCNVRKLPPVFTLNMLGKGSRGFRLLPLPPQDVQQTWQVTKAVISLYKRGLYREAGEAQRGLADLPSRVNLKLVASLSGD